MSHFKYGAECGPGRIKRLHALAALLSSGESTTAAEAASELEVSPRTWRDIQILREKGIPIEADAGRGGGIRMQRNWSSRRLQLEFQQAIDLLISLAVAERMRSSIFLADLTPVRRKLIASFAPALRRRLDEVKSRILVAPSASPLVLSRYADVPGSVATALHAAFVMRRLMTVEYCDERGRDSERKIEPHYLMVSYPVWYVLGWDWLRSSVRTFRSDRIRRAEMLEERFRLRRIADFKGALEGTGAASL